MMLIKFATRGRPEWFRRAIANILQTIHTEDFLILVTADHNDPSMHNDAILEFIDRHDQVKIIFGTSTDKINAINRDMDQIQQWDVLVNTSDDMVFVKPGWDMILLQRVHDTWGDSLDWFAHFNDGYAGEALSTLSIMGRAYYDRDGYIYHPSYRSFSCDAEAMYVAMMRRRHKYFSDILFKHQHPGNTPMPGDETYRTNSRHTPHDTKNYFERLKRYFDEPEGREILLADPHIRKFL